MIKTTSDKEKEFTQLFNVCQAALAIHIMQAAGQTAIDADGNMTFSHLKLITNLCHISRIQYMGVDEDVFDNTVIIRCLLECVSLDHITELIEDLTASKDDDELLNYLITVRSVADNSTILH